MKRINLLIFFVLILINCHKVEKIKNKVMPENPYLKTNIDRFYWETVSEDHNVVPLVKPYKLMRVTGSKDWYLPTKSNDYFDFKNGSTVKLTSFSSVTNCNIFPPYIFGIDEEVTSVSPDTNISVAIKPRLYFIINADNNNLNVYEDFDKFKEELIKLKLPNDYSTPDYLFEQFKDNPILPWFPEDIRKQLESIKNQQ